MTRLDLDQGSVHTVKRERRTHPGPFSLGFRRCIREDWSDTRTDPAVRPPSLPLLPIPNAPFLASLTPARPFSRWCLISSPILGHLRVWCPTGAGATPVSFRSCCHRSPPVRLFPSSGFSPIETPFVSPESASHQVASPFAVSTMAGPDNGSC